MSEILILEWSRDRLSAIVAVEGSRSSVRSAATISSIDHADPQIPVQQAGESLRAWLARESITATKTVVVVPREMVVIRRLQVPQAPADELPDLVRFQAATRTSAPIESLALDFLPLPAFDPAQGQEVISCTLERETLNRITQVCEAAKLTAEHVTISSLTVAELVRSLKASDLGTARPDLIVFQRGQLLELSIVDFGVLVFSHSTMLLEETAGLSAADRLKPLKGDLSRCLVALNQSHPDAGLARCFYVAGIRDQDVLELLEQRFEGNIVQVDAASLNPGKNTAGYEQLIGAALPTRDDHLRIDLLHPRKRREIPNRRRLYTGVGIAIALLIMVFGYSVYYSKKSGLEDSIEDLRSDISRKEESLVKGKPIATAHERLAKWNESDSNPIELWNRLRTLLGGTDQLYFLELKLIPSHGEIQAQFVGRGNAKSRGVVDMLNQTLSDHGFRVRPTTATQVNRDPDYPWGFDLNVELPRPASTASAAPQAPSAPSAPPPST